MFGLLAVPLILLIVGGIVWYMTSHKASGTTGRTSIASTAPTGFITNQGAPIMVPMPGSSNMLFVPSGQNLIAVVGNNNTNTYIEQNQENFYGQVPAKVLHEVHLYDGPTIEAKPDGKKTATPSPCTNAPPAPAPAVSSPAPAPVDEYYFDDDYTEADIAYGNIGWYWDPFLVHWYWGRAGHFGGHGHFYRGDFHRFAPGPWHGGFRPPVHGPFGPGFYHGGFGNPRGGSHGGFQGGGHGGSHGGGHR